MGNSHSSARQSTSPTQQSATGTQQQQSGGSLSNQTSARSSRSRYSQFRLFHPSAATTTTSVGASADPSEASPPTTYDYPLTPSTSLSPSVTRIETQHHYNHKHGSSLDSYIAGEQSRHHQHLFKQLQQPGSPAHNEQVDYFFTPSAPIAMGAASSSEKLPKRQPSTRDRHDSASPHSSPMGGPARTRSQRQREGTGAGGHREGTPHSEGSPGPFKPPGPPADGQQQQLAYRERESVSSVSSSYAGAQPMFTHPPRLPLPIQEEELAPGSPVIPPIGTDSDLDVRGLVPNQSILSSQNGEEDIDEDDEALLRPEDPLDHSESGENRRWAVPTEVIWRGQADKIYVTGTFANWSKKFRMNYDPASETARVTLDLLPGTHHLRFIVDGDMTFSRDLPTAVDWTNTLVNYIEVSADPAMVHRYHGDDASGDRSARAASIAYDDSIIDSSGQRVATAAHTKPVSDGTGATSGYGTTGHGSTKPYPTVSGSRGPSEASVSGSGSGSMEKEASGPELMDLPPRHYGHAIPGYLADLDRDEKSARFARASARVADMAQPPTLPGFLSRSILNMATPSKDDTSVLNMPNHTMLNHLATSSIRHGVLATSLTTRYKRKYVTLITYRPTTMDEA